MVPSEFLHLDDQGVSHVRVRPHFTGYVILIFRPTILRIYFNLLQLLLFLS